MGGSQAPSVFRSIGTSRGWGDGDGLSPRRWCHLHLIHCSVLTSDKQTAEEKGSLSPRIPHRALLLVGTGRQWQRRGGGVGSDGGGGSCIPQHRRLVFLGSALRAACEAGVEQNFAFSSPWGLGGQRASPHHYIIPEVQHSLDLETQ